MDQRDLKDTETSYNLWTLFASQSKQRLKNETVGKTLHWLILYNLEKIKPNRWRPIQWLPGSLGRGGGWGWPERHPLGEGTILYFDCGDGKSAACLCRTDRTCTEKGDKGCLQTAPQLMMS